MTNVEISDLLKLNVEKRKKLLDNLSRKGISNKTLDAMDKIPREYFLEPRLFNAAYEDHALPIGNNQTISQPLTVALMTDLLEVRNGVRALEIGTGSGYQSLILHLLGAEVYTIERIPMLFAKAVKTFNEFNAEIKCFLGDGTLGIDLNSQFERIIVTAGAPFVPEELKSQLTIGGIMVIPIGNKTTQIMTKVIRLNTDEYDYSEHNSFRFVPLIGKSGWSE